MSSTKFESDWSSFTMAERISKTAEADRLGDLDHEIKQVLDRTDPKNSGVTMSARLNGSD